MSNNLPKKLSDVLDKQSLRYSENLELRTAVQLIPYIGGALDMIISAEGIRIQKERVENFLNELKEGMNKLSEEKIDKEFLESEEFFSLFQMTIEKVIRNYEKQKIGYFRNIFVNSVKVNLSETYYKEGFINKLSNLSVIHIGILKFYHERDAVLKKEGRESFGFTSPHALYQNFGNVGPAYLDAYCNDLLRDGFLYIAARDGNITSIGKNNISYKPTEYASEFMKFITLKEDND